MAIELDAAALVVSRHPHPLLWFPPGKRYECSGCKEDGRNGGFECTLPSCEEFKLHLECAQLPRVFQDSIHVSEDLDFHFGSKISCHNCSACQNTIRGFLFKVPRRRRCVSLLKPSLRFHPLCITLPELLPFTRHADHPALQLVKGKDGDYKCSFCHRLCRGWRYDCQCCTFALDLTCAKLDMHGLLHPHVQNPFIPQHGNQNGVAAAAVNIFGRVAGAAVGAALQGFVDNLMQ